jgi:INO80 complex subunit C
MPPKNSKGKKPGPDGTATPQTPSLADQLSYLHIPRPFKNSAYTKNVNRRNKNQKQVLNADKEREKAERLKRQEEAMQVDGEAQPPSVQDVPTYSSVEAPPSIIPQRRYCDITGLEAPYTEPTSRLRYHDKNIYEIVKSLNPAAQQAYLALRGSSTMVK